jgi:hypothetical protein
MCDYSASLCITGCVWLSHRCNYVLSVIIFDEPQQSYTCEIKRLRRDLHSTPNVMFQSINFHAWLSPLYTDLRLVSIVSENAARSSAQVLVVPRSSIAHAAFCQRRIVFSERPLETRRIKQTNRDTSHRHAPCNAGILGWPQTIEKVVRKRECTLLSAPKQRALQK